MTLSDGAIIAGLILFTIGFFRLLKSIFEWHNDQKLIKTGDRATGTITDTITFRDDDYLNSGQHRFIAEFKTKDNTTAYSKSRFVSRSKEKYLNTKVIIIYDAKNPQKSRFENDISMIRDVYMYIIILILGIGLMLFGYFYQ